MNNKFEISFNSHYHSEESLLYLHEAISTGKLSGNGTFSKRCNLYFEKHFGFKKNLLTASATDALEMAAILLNIKQGDEFILPSYTFTSSANAFMLRGAHPIFADTCRESPHVGWEQIEPLLSKKTKAILLVHYGGVACEMDEILSLARQYDIPVVEDCAQAIGSKYKDEWLGTFGSLAAFSFHSTKNISCGEGGLLVLNKPELLSRAENIWEKGTNRITAQKENFPEYEWVDVGSSYLPSELTSAFLYGQLQNLHRLQDIRKSIFDRYQNRLKSHSIQFCSPPVERPSNGHLFYILTPQKLKFVAYMASKGIECTTHYVPLHKSKYGMSFHDGRRLPNTDFFYENLVRLPLHPMLTEDQIDRVTDEIKLFFKI